MARSRRSVDPQHVPDAQVTIADFGGWKPNSDPHDLRPGESTGQTNAMSWKPGELRVRPGFRAVQFDTD